MRYLTCSWQAYVALMTSTLLFTSCRSTQSSSKFLGEVGLQTGFPPETTRLWEDYQTKAAAGGFEYQPDCAPKSIAAKGASKGLVIIYHGFTGCPNQFGNVAAELSDLGFDVLLPTLPGNGRKPINQAFLDANSAPSARQKIIEDVRNNRQSNVIQDDISGIPFKTVDYFSYAEEMTKIAKSYPGPRILIGLSLGGGLATATLVKGADLKDPGEVNVWSRSLLITPFFKAPSIQGVAADVTGSVAPNFKAGFGNDCEAGQLEVGYRFRNGICDFTGGQIDTLQNLGKEVSAKEQMSKIQIPIQIIGVANDNTSDNTAVIKAFGFTSPNLTRICFYPEGVGHATIVAGDFVPFLSNDTEIVSTRERNAVPRFTRYWARHVQDRIIEFVANGFSPDGGPFRISAVPTTETNASAKGCEFQVNYDDILKKNRELCASDPRVDPDYCGDLEQAIQTACSKKSIDPLPAGNSFKAYCQSRQF